MKCAFFNFNTLLQMTYAHNYFFSLIKLRISFSFFTLKSHEYINDFNSVRMQLHLQQPTTNATNFFILQFFIQLVNIVYIRCTYVWYFRSYFVSLSYSMLFNAHRSELTLPVCYTKHAHHMFAPKTQKKSEMKVGNGKKNQQWLGE